VGAGLLNGLAEEMGAPEVGDLNGIHELVERVSWCDATAFCENASEKTGQTVRLPTEAQWEFACRAGTTTAYYNGDADADLGRAAWYVGNSRGTLHPALGPTYPVGQKEPNAFGLHDMHGNVFEWCLDHWQESYKPGAVVDPQGPPGGQGRVLRAGFWGSGPWDCRSANRVQDFDPTRAFHIGFRVVVLASGSQPQAPAVPAAQLPVANAVSETTPVAATIYDRWPCDEAEAQRRQEETARALKQPATMELDLGNGVKLDLVLIPAGKFTETDEDPYGDETQREVTVSRPLYMGKYEMTQEQYEAVLGKNPSYFKGARNPVENVSWADAQGFCRKLSAKTGKTIRLPTEAEWEYACRAGTTTRCYLGQEDEDLEKAGWFDGNSGKKTHPVGEKTPNAWGLYDMHGNVSELCQDWYEEHRPEATVDPQGPAEGQYRVWRGGSWNFPARICRPALRKGLLPDNRCNAIGFRVVVVAAPSAGTVLPAPPQAQPGTTNPNPEKASPARSAAATAESLTITSLAGSPESGQGATDGAARVAQFNNPSGAAVDGSGNVYVADRANSTIRKITPAGVVSTLAGLAGKLGSADGTSSAARPAAYPRAAVLRRALSASPLPRAVAHSPPASARSRRHDHPESAPCIKVSDHLTRKIGCLLRKALTKYNCRCGHAPQYL